MVDPIRYSVVSYGTSPPADLPVSPIAPNQEAFSLNLAGGIDVPSGEPLPQPAVNDVAPAQPDVVIDDGPVLGGVVPVEPVAPPDVVLDDVVVPGLSVEPVAVTAPVTQEQPPRPDVVVDDGPIPGGGGEVVSVLPPAPVSLEEPAPATPLPADSPPAPSLPDVTLDFGLIQEPVATVVDEPLLLTGCVFSSYCSSNLVFEMECTLPEDEAVATIPTPIEGGAIDEAAVDLQLLGSVAPTSALPA
jgi:hypothetical protein